MATVPADGAPTLGAGRVHASTWRHQTLLALTVVALALCFAEVEIQIEGAAGWAASLPTWRIERHWLLDLFWGGRAMTGYHAWVFPFMALAFHLPAALTGSWSWRLEARALASLALFWIAEDALWFALNPAFGIAALTPERATWHPHWILGLPRDYWMFGGFGLLAWWWSFRRTPVRAG